MILYAVSWDDGQRANIWADGDADLDVRAKYMRYTYRGNFTFKRLFERIPE